MTRKVSKYLGEDDIVRFPYRCGLKTKHRYF